MKGKEKVSLPLLEKYRLGELPAREKRRVERLIAASPELRQELEALDRADKEILERYPPERLIPEIRKRSEVIRHDAQPRRAVSIRPRWIAVPALALILLVILIPMLREKATGPAGSPQATEVRIKGNLPTAPLLQIFRKRNGNTEKLENGNMARPGDLLQIAYAAASDTQGIILSIDGKGAVTLHFPEDPAKSTALKTGRRILLPNAYELDNAPRFERFFFITSREKIPVSQVLEKAKALAADQRKALSANLDLPARFRQFSFFIRKGGNL